MYLKLKVKRSAIRAIIIKKQSNSYIRYEMFKRLNTGGSLLSAQEIRNCSSRMVDGGGDSLNTTNIKLQSTAFQKSCVTSAETKN